MRADGVADPVGDKGLLPAALQLHPKMSCITIPSTSAWTREWSCWITSGNSQVQVGNRHPGLLVGDVQDPLPQHLGCLHDGESADVGLPGGIGPRAEGGDVGVLGGHHVELYPCPNVECDSWTVYTNRPSAGAMRGYGIPQAMFAGESHIDDTGRT